MPSREARSRPGARGSLSDWLRQHDQGGARSLAGELRSPAIPDGVAVRLRGRTFGVGRGGHRIAGVAPRIVRRPTAAPTLSTPCERPAGTIRRSSISIGSTSRPWRAMSSATDPLPTGRQPDGAGVDSRATATSRNGCSRERRRTSRSSPRATWKRPRRSTHLRRAANLYAELAVATLAEADRLPEQAAQPARTARAGRRGENFKLARRVAEQLLELCKKGLAGLPEASALDATDGQSKLRDEAAHQAGRGPLSAGTHQLRGSSRTTIATRPSSKRR